MARDFTEGQLNALLVMFGGVDVLAETLDLDEDALERLIEGRRVSEDFRDDFDNALRKWKRRETGLADTVDRVAGVLDWYPEIIEILNNDGVADALIKYPQFADIFYKDPTKWQDPVSGKWYSDGGLYPGAIQVIIDYATRTKKGQPRKRGQADLSPMIEALIADGFEIGEIDDSEFWKWFRGIYGS